jgi:CRP/FNR family cyclic AMP-dependent transcriptional regulator
MDKAASLRQVPIFCTLEPKHLATLAEMMRHQHYRKGQIIFYCGDPGDAMYLLIRGSVMMTLPSDTGSEVIVGRLLPGDHFGELAVLDGRPAMSPRSLRRRRKCWPSTAITCWRS